MQNIGGADEHAHKSADWRLSQPIPVGLPLRLVTSERKYHYTLKLSNRKSYRSLLAFTAITSYAVRELYRLAAGGFGAFRI